MRAIQQQRDTNCHQVFFFFQGKAPKKIHAIKRNIMGTCTSFATVKNRITQFKRGDFSTCVAPCAARPKTATIPEFTDRIHELILEDRSHESVGSIIHEDLDKWQGVLFLHNALVHQALATQKKPAYLGFQCLDQTLYPPELAPSEY
jgi:hypothetical protein